MDTSSSSKVTVEYHDPSGIFPLVLPRLASRLPLRDLNWKSSNRPTRQIKSLHLDFVPDDFTKDSLRPAAPRLDSNGTTSLDIVRSGLDPRKDAVRERRHQIPGLKTSPYLKIYVLRADDKTTYKEVQRQKIREWIRDNATANAKGKGENHEAYEWMILHVVIPDTTAATERRWRESTANDETELKERKQGIKLPGKSTRTTFDKLRADFNESGKNRQDRVAQVRLTRADTPYDVLPTPAMATTLEETDEEREKTWNDLMSKIRTLVLVPFDLRVRQYEADIAEQDSRRAMPGFNFCTFFIHKEGLAKALESIGLVADALVIYDELSLGFETVLKDIARGQAEGTATTFAPYTVDIKERITGSVRPQINGSAKVQADSSSAQSLGLNYRERIVRSDISVFDFSCYIFARQNALILRLANANVVRTMLDSAAKDSSEDLVLISEVCWRAASFIHNNTRSLRQDLNAHRAAQWEKKDGAIFFNDDLESLVCSWTYITAGQMLDETYSPVLERLSEQTVRGSLQNGMNTSLKRPDLGGVSEYPQRTASLPARKSRVSKLQSRDSLQSASETDLMSPPSTSDGDAVRSGDATPGLTELVTYRAELLMMQRKMLEQVAKQRGWRAGWGLIRDETHDKMEDVDLNGKLDLSPEESDDRHNRTPSLLLAPALSSALESKATFHETYERLSNKAMRNYVSATQSKCAEAIMGDLAILKYQQGDYGYAASYFQHVLPIYAEEEWSLMEIEALRMHAKCLLELDRKQEYVVTLLALVAKACGLRKASSSTAKRMPTFDEMLDVGGVLANAIAFSATLDVEVTTPAGAYFSDLELETEIMFHEDRDGFVLRLQLRHLLEDEVQVDHVSARLYHADDPSLEIWLRQSDTILRLGMNHIDLECSTVAFGPFLVDKIMLRASKLIFVHELSPKGELEPSPLGITEHDRRGTSVAPHERPWIFIYPAQQAFDAELSLSRHIQIDKQHYLELKLSAGWNEIESIDLRLKPASAGLRLHLADATLEDIRKRHGEASKAGQLSLANLSAGEQTLIKVPYSLEQAGQEITIHLDASYQTPKGLFRFFTSARLPTQLPLDVDVNDLFHLDTLFSNFTVRSTRQTPLSITAATLESSLVYDVEAPPILPMPMDVFDKQPVKLIYKISKKRTQSRSTSKQEAALALKLRYISMEELIVGTLRERFVTALDDSTFAPLRRLLVPLFCERTRQLLPTSDLEVAVLLHEARLPSFEAFGWQDIVNKLPASTRQQLITWLEGWHQNNANVVLQWEAEVPETRRSISISVDVPNVDFVHSALLSMQAGPDHYHHGSRIVKVGQPIESHLRITSTTGWSTSSVLQVDGHDQQHPEHGFIFDLQFDPESWVIGGQRRGHFTATDDATSTFDLMLIPLKLGYLPLPNVEIQVQQNNNLEEDGNSPEKPSEQHAVSWETHCESAGQIVQVIQGLRTRRVHVPELSNAPRPVSRPNTATTTRDAG